MLKEQLRVTSLPEELMADRKIPREKYSQILDVLKKSEPAEPPPPVSSRVKQSTLRPLTFFLPSSQRYPHFQSETYNSESGDGSVLHRIEI